MDGATLDFALLGHPESYDHLADLLLSSAPGYGRDRLDRHRRTFAKLFEWAPPYLAPDPIELRRPDGTAARGRLFVATFLPDAIETPRSLAAATRKVGQACRLASERGARIIGLGGFTSVVDGAQGGRLAGELGVVTTSGNSLTSALAVAQLDRLVAALDWDWGELPVALVGATGDIGRACAIALARRTRSLTLIARNAPRLAALRRDTGDAVATSTTNDDAYAARLIVTVTSAARPVLDEARLAPGAVVLDVGYPKNVAALAARRRDVLIAAGGLARLPVALALGRYTRIPFPDVVHGCFAETMVLALARRFERFSAGQGQITADRMAEILELAAAFGIGPAPLARGDELVTAGDLAAIRALDGAWA